jgi:hypothetical protein
MEGKQEPPPRPSSSQSMVLPIFRLSAQLLTQTGLGAAGYGRVCGARAPDDAKEAPDQLWRPIHPQQRGRRPAGKLQSAREPKCISLKATAEAQCPRTRRSAGYNPLPNTF